MSKENTNLLLGWIIGIYDKNKNLNFYSKNQLNKFFEKPSWTTLISDAKVFIDLQEMLDIYRGLSDVSLKGLGERKNLKFFKTNILIQEIDISSEMYANSRKLKAIEKLGPDEIEILNLEKISMQIKLGDKPLTKIYEFYPNETPANKDEYNKFLKELNSSNKNSKLILTNTP